MTRDTKLQATEIPKPVHELALILIGAEIMTLQIFKREGLHPMAARELAMEWIARREGHMQKSIVDDGYRAAWLMYRALPSLGWTHDGKSRDVAACIIAGMG